MPGVANSPCDRTAASGLVLQRLARAGAASGPPPLAHDLATLHCLLILPYYPGWGLALLLAQAGPPYSKDRQRLGTNECYKALQDPPAWAHLLACRAYPRQAHFEDALASLKKARLAPLQLPPHYTWLTMALTGSTSHLEL